MTIDELVNQAFKVSSEYKILDDPTIQELNGIGRRFLSDVQADMLFVINERNKMLVGTKQLEGQLAKAKAEQTVPKLDQIYQIDIKNVPDDQVDKVRDTNYSNALIDLDNGI